MPKFDAHNYSYEKAESKTQRLAKRAGKKSKNLISVPNCHVCQSDHRTEIESLCIMGRPYTRVGEAFDIDRRSISKHAKEHVNHEHDAMRRIVEDHASQLQVDHEEGVRGALLRRAWLDAAMMRAWEDLVEGRVEFEPRDIIQVIREQQAMDDRTESTAAQALWSQFNSFKLAIARVVPKEYHAEILKQAQLIFEGEEISEEAPKLLEEAELVSEGDESDPSDGDSQDG